MSKVVTTEIRNGIGIVAIDSPPVNALGHAVRAGLLEAFATLASDDAVKAVVLTCRGRTFVAGADITEFGRPPQEPSLNAVFDVMESMKKPIVAAIHGTALGGGMELSLVCHFRVAVPSAKMGLPEVNLGLLPGAGGTQRLPRLIGPAAALDFIVSGKPIGAKQALEAGIIDALAEEGQLERDAIAFAEKAAAQGALPHIRNRDDKVAQWRGKPELFADFIKKNARVFKGFKAPGHIVKAVEAAVELPFDQGLARETELFRELLASTESAAQRYYFFAERSTKKIPDVPADTATLDIRKVGVIGAGTMGGGITMNFLNVGIPVTLVELKQDALDRGIAVIRKNYENTAKKGRMTSEQVEQRMALIQPALGLEALSDVDLVIEAVFESMAVKKDVFGKLDTICKPGAILASNTSFLDIDEIATATKRPEDVIGLHFFSPANVMRLLEVVRGAKTRKEVIATSLALASKIGKVPVLSRVCPGFIANRMLKPRIDVAEALVLEGNTPVAVDAAMTGFGFAMGHFATFDLIGLDVLGRDSNVRTTMSDLVALDRLGQKKNGGYYDYDEARKATPAPVAAEVIAKLAADRKIAQKEPLGEEELVARLLYPMVNEGARILEEGVAIRASDIDIACVLGFNWPVFTGGPMFWADTVGLGKIVAKLDEMAGLYGEEFAPAKLLKEKAASGGSFTR